MMNPAGLEQIDIMLYDDERSVLETLKRIIAKLYGFQRIETEDNIVNLRIDLAINRPKVLILDYTYAGGLNLSYVNQTLQSFKGLGIIYSGESRERVESELGPLPYNFYFVEKGDFRHLRRVLDTTLKRLVS